MLRKSEENEHLFKKTLRGFSHINRYWDKQKDIVTAKILPGEFYVTTNNENIVTTLGSCVSACIRDTIFGIGGMNHFMLPISSQSTTVIGEGTRYGNFAMEHLINEILKHGGVRDNLEVKIFGGGKILAQMTDIGIKNIHFVENYLKTESMKVVSRDLGDVYPRKVSYNPKTGKVFVKKLRSLHNDTISVRERQYLDSLKHSPKEGEIDLF